MRTAFALVVWASGLVFLLGTTRRDLLRHALYSANLLLPPVADDRACDGLILLTRHAALKAGTSKRSTCQGCAPEQFCQKRLLKMHEEGYLVLYEHRLGGAAPVWRSSVKKWWWQRPAVSTAYWARIADSRLELGQGDKILRSRPLRKCRSLLNALRIHDKE